MAAFAAPEQVLVRAVSDGYAGCLRVDRALEIEVPAARRQHAAYAAALRDLGVPVEEIAAEPGSPDCCFVEDAAVVLDAGALSTRPGAASRRGEPEAVAVALARHRAVHRMLEPATLDGGDVLRVDRRLFVGLSSRTNPEGVEVARRVAGAEGIEVVALQVKDGLHLKSACSLAGPGLLVYDRRALDGAALAALRAAGLECMEVDEPTGANVLAIGASVLVSAAAPRTAARLSSAGLDVRTVEVGEFHKGDGALTCLSLRIPRAGAWTT